MKVGKMEAAPACLKLAVEPTSVAALGVNRKQEVINGYVVAEAGSFKSPGRGAFDHVGLKKIVQLMNAKKAGVKVHWGHETLFSNSLNTLIGRARNARMDGDSRVRADLFLLKSAHSTADGDLASRAMDLVEEASDLIGSSLVLAAKEEYRKKKDGSLETDRDGSPLPPLWKPEEIYASDLVGDGDAVHGGLLCSSAIPPEIQNRFHGMLTKTWTGDLKNFRTAWDSLLDRFIAQQLETASTHGDIEQYRADIEAQQATLLRLTRGTSR